MEYICHRMNRREELKKVPEGCGVEIDLPGWSGWKDLSGT